MTQEDVLEAALFPVLLVVMLIGFLLGCLGALHDATEHWFQD